MSDLPPSWEWATLDDVGDYINGRAFKNSEWSTEGRPIVRIQNLTGTSKAFNYFSGMLDERHTARNGDLLISWAATLGAYIWRGSEATINQHIFKVRSYIDAGFHHYLVEYLTSQLYSRAHGSGTVHVTRAKFGCLEFKLPPLAEQRRIVAVLEDHLSRLDSGLASLRATSRRLQRFRDQVIIAGCTGSFFGMKGASALPPPHVGLYDESLPRIPEHWRWVRLYEVADIVGGITKDSKK